MPGGERVMAATQKASRPSPSKPMQQNNADARPGKAGLLADIGASTGQPLDGSLRNAFERGEYSRRTSGAVKGRSAFDRLEADADRSARANRPDPQAAMQRDFSSVRMHSDSFAQSAARRLKARAFTYGDHVFVDPAALPADSSQRRELFAHEAAHIMQQRQLGRQIIQPRLIVTGSDADIQRLLDLMEPAMGEDLEHDAATNEITAVATLGSPATSPAFAAAMHRIMDDAAQDAEANIGVAQAGVAVGAFPIPADMTGSTVQRIDIDDVEAIETGAPGNGLGKIAHELTENYTGHAAVAAAGVSQFPASHGAGLSAESDVAEDTVGPGRRVAGVDTPVVANAFTRVQDFENYYLTFTLTRTGSDFAVSNAQQAARINISTHTIDNFVTGSFAVPAAGAADIAAAAADVAANNDATVRIEGFTDDVGAAVTNVILSNRRATSAETGLAGAGVGRGRIHAVGLGETRPVAPNTNDANRARNRRVVITVDRPDI